MTNTLLCCLMLNVKMRLRLGNEIFNDKNVKLSHLSLKSLSKWKYQCYLPDATLTLMPSLEDRRLQTVTWFQFHPVSTSLVSEVVCDTVHCVPLQSLICHTCWWRMETWRWRSTMNTFTDGAIISRPPRRTPAMRGKWVWHHRYQS